MQKVKTVIDEINTAVGEQSKGLEQMNQAIGQIGKITQQSSVDADNNVEATNGLLAQSEKLDGVVREMKAFIGDTRRKSAA
jgi:methyl-accepting chemotaxis protein